MNKYLELVRRQQNLKPVSYTHLDVYKRQEFKCNNKQPQMIGEYISALSNSAALCERPKAYLVWGVDDATHKIVGTEFQYRKMKKGNEELEAWLSRMLSPRINFRFFEVPMDEGMVVLMEIPCAEKQPVQFAGCLLYTSRCV